MGEFKPYPKQGVKPKKEKQSLKRTRIKYKKKDTGQVAVFNTKAETEEWFCYVTGEKLWQLKANQFMHVLSKALNKYPHFKTYPKNIVFATDEVHTKWDHGSREELKKDPAFDKLFALEAELKLEYEALYGKRK